MKLLRRTHQQRIKNCLQPHDWRETDEGYDPAKDGPDQRWGRHVIECATCGERRRVFLSLDEMSRDTGCWRRGSLPYRVGDLIIVPDDGGTGLRQITADGRGRVDHFERKLSGRRALTRNAGGFSSTSRLEDLRPY